MISTPFFSGMGLGNQLANYVTLRAIALDKGYDFGIMYPENFKGASFMNLDMGLPVIGGVIPVEGQPPTVLPEGIQSYYREEMIGNGEYDPKIFELEDNTLIHGNLQGEKYFEKHKEKIKEWLKVEKIGMSDWQCVINFRGGEYKYVPDFYLPQSYWNKAIEQMVLKGVTYFVVVTDDVEEAKKYFPNFHISHEMKTDYEVIASAKNLILSNSSFAWFPAWLGDAKTIIAPKFWGRHNRGYWFLEQNKTDKFTYI